MADPTNPVVLADHLRCAAYELPLPQDQVAQVFGDAATQVHQSRFKIVSSIDTIKAHKYIKYVLGKAERVHQMVLLHPWLLD